LNTSIIEFQGGAQYVKKKIISHVCDKLENPHFIEQHKSMPEDFTRARKLPFFTVCVLILRNSVKSLQVMLNEFVLQTKKVKTITASAFSQARKKLKHTAFIALNEDIVAIYYREKAIQRLKGYRVLAFDGSKLTLPSSEEIKAAFGSKAIGNQMEQSLGEYSTATFEVCYDVLNHIAVYAVLGSCKAYEVDLARALFKDIKQDDLLIFDRGYAGYPFLVALTENKMSYIIRCSHSTFAPAQAMFSTESPMSKIVTLSVPNTHKKKISEQGLPCEITVRLIKVILSTGEIEVLLTSLLDEQTFPATSFAELYHLRWGVETFFSKIKGRLAVENFTGKSVEAIKQDFWSTIFMSNLETILVEDVEIEMNEKVPEGKLTKVVNKAVSFNAIKNLAFDLLSSQRDKEQILSQLTTLFLMNTRVVRKDRTAPRYKISDTRSLNFQKRAKKQVF
jgi:hypothetical protein